MLSKLGKWHGKCTYKIILKKIWHALSFRLVLGMTEKEIQDRIEELTQVIRETNCTNTMTNAQLSINGLKLKLKEIQG